MTEAQKERDALMRRVREARRRTNPQRKEYLRQYKQSNKPRLMVKQKQRRAEKNKNPKHRINHSLRARLARFITGVGTGSIQSLVGCTKDQLVNHIESQFTKRMNWENYGRYWHIDHIIPCSSFDLTKANHRKICWHWTNLRPLEAKKNISKGASITEPQMSLLLCVSH